MNGSKGCIIFIEGVTKKSYTFVVIVVDYE